MKSKKILLAILAIALVFGMTACSNGGGGSAPPPSSSPSTGPTSTVYESKDEKTKDIYILEITSSAAKSIRAAYTPKDGDNYNLSIMVKTGGTKTSSGKVKVESGGKLSLSEGSDLTVTISNDGKMEEIKGTIRIKEGGTLTAPGIVIPTEVKTPKEIELVADIWNSEWSGEAWNHGIDYFCFTSINPRKGDVLRFKLSGTTNKPLKWLIFSLQSYSDDEWTETQYLGRTQTPVSVSGTFEKYFDLVIYEDNNLENVMLMISDILWEKDPDGEYVINTGRTLPAGVTNYETVMATISDFNIRLVGMWLNLE